MADSELILNIRARIDDLKAKLREAAKEVEGLKPAAEQGASGFGALLTAAKGFVAFAAAQQFTRIAAGLYEMAAGAERSENALNRLTDGNADDYIKAVENATHGAVSELDAMAASNRALALNVVSSAEEMERLTEVAVALGRNTGRSPTEALDDLVKGIGRASPLILDNVGILLTESEIQEDVNRLKAEDATLTDAQARKQATYNLVMREGTALLADQGATAEDAASQAEQLSAEWKNFGVTMGGVVTDAIGPALTNLNNLIDQANQISDAMEDRRATTAASAASFEDYVRTLNEYNLVSDIQLKAMEANNFEATATLPITQHLIDEYEALKVSQEESSGAAIEHGESLRRAAAAASLQVDGIRTVTEATDEATKSLEKHSTAAKKDLDITAGEGLFADMFDNAAEEAKAALEKTGGLQGLASVVGTEATKEEGVDKDAIREGVYQLFVQAGATPGQRFRIRKALGLASSEELEFERTAIDIVKAYLGGQLTDTQLADAVQSLEQGNLTAAQGFLPQEISGSMLDKLVGSGTAVPQTGGSSGSTPAPTRSNYGGNYTPATSQAPGSGMGGGSPSSSTVKVDITGATSLEEIALRGVEAGMKAVGINVRTSGPGRF